MKKILAVYDFLKEIGGLERVMFFQANRLKKEYDVRLIFGYISKKDKLRIINELELDKSIEVKQMSKFKNEFIQLIRSFLFPSRIKKHDADLLISHSFMASRMAHYKKKKEGTPYIVVLYHPPNFIYSNMSGWVNNIPRFFAKMLGSTAKSYIKKRDYDAVRSADAVIAISEYSAKRARAIYGIKPVIIYPQISKFFKLISPQRKKVFLNKKKIKREFMLAHGRIIPDKNYSDLIDIVKTIENTDLIISGSISQRYKSELTKKIDLLGLNDRVKILGRIPSEDLLGYYNCARVFLLAAKKEDFGLTPVEAMACGCPVIAWDDGSGPSETVKAGVNGFLAKPYSLKDFEDKIKFALKKKWDKKTIVNSVHKFSEDEISKEFLALVGKILKGSRDVPTHK